MNTVLSFLTAVLLAAMFTCHQPAVTSAHSASQQDSIYTYATPTRDGIGKFYMGREIAAVMGTGGGPWLNRPEREKEEGTKLVIANLPVGNKTVAADVGAGTGYYSFRIAKTYPASKVLAIEIQQPFIQALNEKIATDKIDNVEVIKGSEKSINLTDTSVDLAIMVDVYHELEFPHEMLQSVYRALKPGGKLLLLEYRKEDPSVPIKELHKMTVEQANRELRQNGFKPVEALEFLPIQHYLIYEKHG